MAGQFISEYPHNAIGLAGQIGCLHCGSPRRRDERLYQFDKLVDEIVDLDGNTHSANVAVICGSCVVEIAAKLGCLGPDQATALQNEVSSLRSETASQRDQLHSRRDLTRTLSRLTELAGDLRPHADA